MTIDKLVDPGEVYVVGQYEIGTSNPTAYYKIGIVQNDRTTAFRVSEHQTGNPNRIFIAAKITAEASYIVEQQMHRLWNGVRVGKEWFDLSGPSDISNVITQINNLEAQYGPQVQQLRGLYYATPTSGHNSTLTPAQITQAEQLRDDFLVLLDQMALLKYQYETYAFQLRITNGLQPAMDCITKFTIKPPETKFKEALLPAALKAKYMTKPRKNKNDFRFNFPGIKAQIEDLKLDAAHWKAKYSVEHALWEQEKATWKAMEITITPTSVNATLRPRTTSAEALHTLHTDALTEFNRLKAETKMLELECRILCNGYEKINNVCTWKRTSQTNGFNHLEFKVNEGIAYLDPVHYSTSTERVSVGTNPYKNYT